jgi:hypothetical protein
LLKAKVKRAKAKRRSLHNLNFCLRQKLSALKRSGVERSNPKGERHNLNFCLRQKLSALKRSGVERSNPKVSLRNLGFEKTLLTTLRSVTFASVTLAGCGVKRSMLYFCPKQKYKMRSGEKHAQSTGLRMQSETYGPASLAALGALANVTTSSGV